MSDPYAAALVVEYRARDEDYVRVTVSADVELDAQPVFLAFTAGEHVEPVASDWEDAEWAPTAAVEGADGVWRREARMRYGPTQAFAPSSGTVLAVFARVVDNPVDAKPFAGYARFV